MTKKTLFTGTFASGTLSSGGFMSPSGHFFLAGVKASGVADSLDMHVIRMTDGADVFDRINGGFDYLEVVLPDDTCLFQDTAGGQSTGSPGVQTLYWTALPMTGTTTTATAINTRTANMTPSGDAKQLLYLKTNGDLYSWDATAKSGAGTKIASSVVKYVVGGDATGPVAYIAADGSVHVQSLDGATKMLDTAASSATSFRAPLVLGPDNADVYFFQNGDLVGGGVENNAGTLMRVAVHLGCDAVEDRRHGVDPRPAGLRQRRPLPAEPRRSAGDRHAIRRRGDVEARRHRHHDARHEGAGRRACRR